MAYRKQNKGFLSPSLKNPNIYTWNVRVFGEKKNIFYSAEVTFCIGKTWITIHTNNDGIDKRFVAFRSKLGVIVEHLTDFIEKAVHYNPPKKAKPEVTRIWLNDPEGVDSIFTGSLVTHYTRDECLFEISSCDRSARVYVTPQPTADASGRNLNFNGDALGTLLGIKRAVGECLLCIDEYLKTEQ